MNHEDYEQIKQQCWEEYIAKHGLKNAIPEEPFSFTFDRAFALGKQFGNSEQVDAGTVIQGWVTRDANPHRLFVYGCKPTRLSDMWSALDTAFAAQLDPILFPDLTWESDPEPVEIIIKRKRK